MADRMRRVWSPGTTMGYDTVVAGGAVEYTMMPSSALILAQDREMRDWTITRIVATLQAYSVSTTTFIYGIRVVSDTEAPGTVSPGTDQMLDWMLWGGITVGSNWNSYGGPYINIDNRSQRKSQGMDSTLRLYIDNVGGATGYFAWTGRVLALFS